MRPLRSASLILPLLLALCTAGSIVADDSQLVIFRKSKHADAQPVGLPALTPMRGTGTLSPPKNPDHFTFVVFGDNRPAKKEPQPEAIKEIFKKIHHLRPAFALSLGDIIEGKPKRDDAKAIAKIRSQFAEFLALAAKAGVPIFNAPGNHEMDDTNDIPSERMHELYRECVGPAFGAFNYGNSRFIALNSEDIPPAGTPQPPAGEELSYMSPKQIKLLKHDLDANRDKTHIFITMHYPIHAVREGPPPKEDNRLHPESREALLALFKNYTNISYVLAAHEHLYFNPREPNNFTTAPGRKAGDPIVYLISGGAGAPLSKHAGGFHHYLIFTVDGTNVTVKLVKFDAKGASS